jgi:hypothetical protein
LIGEAAGVAGAGGRQNGQVPFGQAGGSVCTAGPIADE